MSLKKNQMVWLKLWLLAAMLTWNNVICKVTCDLTYQIIVGELKYSIPLQNVGWKYEVAENGSTGTVLD